MAKAKKIRREIEIGGVKRWISGNTEQEYAENLIQALRGETDNQAQFIPPAPEGWRSTKTGSIIKVGVRNKKADKASPIR